MRTSRGRPASRSPALGSHSGSSRVFPLLLALLPLAACGDVTDPEAAPPEALALEPASALLDEGDLLELQASDPAHPHLSLNGSLSWETSDPSVATVEGGMVRAVGIGEASITAVLPGGGDPSATAAVEVVRLPSETVASEPLPEDAVVGEVIDEVAVQVLSRRGSPVEGAQVRFEVVAGAGQASPVVTDTDEEGMARTRWTLGPLAGEQALEVRVEDAPAAGTLLSAEVAPGPPYEISIFPEQVRVRPGVPVRLEAQVRDAYGNRISALPMFWTSGDADVAQVDETGRVVGVTFGTTIVEATAPEGSTAWDELLDAPQGHHREGHDGGRSSVEVSDEEGEGGASISTTGDGQSGVVGEVLPEPIQVRVLDAEGRPLRQVPVEWSVEEGGGSLSDATTRTDGQGRAEATWTLGTSTGSNLARVEVGDLGSASFTATALAGSISEVLVVPSGSAVEAGEELQFEASAVDRYGNPVAGAGEASWSTADPAIASVTPTGLALGLAAGTTEVRASVEGVVGAASLQVSGPAGDDDGSSGGETTDPEDEELDPPGPVTDLTVLETSENTAVLRFTQVDDGAGGAANYQVRFTTSPIGWGWGSATEVTEGSCAGEVMGTSPGEELVCTVEGLAPSTSYDFQLVAYRGLIADGSRVYGELSNVATGVTGSASGTDDGDHDGGGDLEDPPPGDGSLSYPMEDPANALIAWSPMDEYFTWPGSNIAGGTGRWWQYEEGDPDTSILNGEEVPGGPYVNRTRFPAGQRPGTAPVALGGWVASGLAAEQRRIYFSQRIRLVDSGTGDWESQSVGTKLGFWAAGRCSGAENELYTFLQGGTHSEFNIRMVQQNVQSRSLRPNRKDGPFMRVGEWHHWEMEMVLNDIGSANGVFRWWIDGELIAEYTDVVYRTSSNPCGFRGYKWNPTWGGSGTTNKQRTDYIDVSDIRISGLPL